MTGPESGGDPGALTERASRLKAEGRQEEALALYEQVVRLLPRHPVPEHNIAAACADLQRFAAAEAATRRAFQKGSRAPETWLIHARALQGQDKLDEAEAAFREAARLRPGFVEAQKGLAELVWIRSEDVGAALGALAGPETPALTLARAAMLSNAGDEAGAFGALLAAVQARPADPQLLLALSAQAMKAGRVADAAAAAERAQALAPQDPRAEAARCEAYLALGWAEQASEAAGRLRAQAPADQGALALQATCWRLLGDPRYAELYDYAALVKAYAIDPPQGWASREAYLADLGAALAGLHSTRGHPLGQSVRGGSQTNQNLLVIEHPAVKAFPAAVDGPIRAYLAALGPGHDPLRARNRGGYRMAGAWSVRLRPGGFHIDHVHPQGWISSALYVSVPKGLSAASREGWIRFGQPGPRTAPPLPAEHFVEPEPGRLVLFPAYMWHGVEAFGGDETRLTIAFDLVP